MLKIGKLYRPAFNTSWPTMFVDFVVSPNTMVRDKTETIQIDIKNKTLLYLGEQTTRDCGGTIGHKFLIDGKIGYFPYRTFKPRNMLKEVIEDDNEI